MYKKLYFYEDLYEGKTKLKKLNGSVMREHVFLLLWTPPSHGFKKESMSWLLEHKEYLF